MPNRRDFMIQSAAVSSLLAFHRTGTTQAAASRSPNRLRLLILGGTGFLGSHFVKAALDRGHRVSVFSRGKDAAELPESVERLIGDRSGNLESIKNRDWDAVFDLATYVPGWVRTLGQALSGRVGHYTFISTIITYKYPGAKDENSEVLSYEGTVDPYSFAASTPPPGQYGPLKVLCEQEAERQFPGKAIVLRLGHPVGPRERIGALTYWVARMAQGGEILAPGDAYIPVQLIDLRDFAEWAVRMSEEREAGIFNAVGPASSLSWGEMLGALRGAFSVPAFLTWVPIPWLLEQRAPSVGALLFWANESGGTPGIWKLSNEKAKAHGLTYRPLSTTILDTSAWYKSLTTEQQTSALMRWDEKSRALSESMAREREFLAAWHGRGKPSER